MARTAFVVLRVPLVPSVPLALLDQDTFAVAAFLVGLGFVAGAQGKKELALRLYHCADQVLADMGEVLGAVQFPLEPNVRELIVNLNVNWEPR